MNVYVEPAALESWKAQMEQINSECIRNLENIEKKINSLDSSMKGASATSLVNSITKFIELSKGNHEKMRNVEIMLDTVVDVMSQQ